MNAMNQIAKKTVTDLWKKYNEAKNSENIKEKIKIYTKIINHFKKDMEFEGFDPNKLKQYNYLELEEITNEILKTYEEFIQENIQKNERKKIQ